MVFVVVGVIVAMFKSVLSVYSTILQYIFFSMFINVKSNLDKMDFSYGLYTMSLNENVTFNFDVNVRICLYVR